jgi:predicted transcriptional regulator
MVPDMSDRGLRALVADITAAYCTRNRLAIAEVPAFIKSVFAVLAQLGDEPPAVLSPAVAIRDSIKPDYIVCLEDGRKLKLLRGHLRSAFNMTPDQYRTKWGLRSDYPMVAPNYSMTRSKLALACGLGRGRGAEPATALVKLVSVAPIGDPPTGGIPG